MLHNLLTEKKKSLLAEIQSLDLLEEDRSLEEEDRELKGLC